MNKQLQLVMAMALLLLSVNTNAQYLQSDYYGFEDADINGDGSNLAFGWWITADANNHMIQSNEFASEGTYSLKIGSDDYSLNADKEWRADCGATAKIGSEPSITIPGDYVLSFKVYIPSGDNTIIDKIKTIYSDPKDNYDDGVTNVWAQTQWDLSSVTVRDAWVTLRATINIPTVGTKAEKPKQIQLRVLGDYRPNSGAGYIYIDDIKLEDPIDTDNPDFIMDYSYFGFEYGPDSWWINEKHRTHAMLSTDEVATGAYALEVIADPDFAEDTKLPVTSTSGKGGYFKVISGSYYAASLKVFVESNKTYFSEFLTNVKAASGSGYQTIKWELPNDIARDEWVELTQLVYYNPDDVVAGEPVLTEMAMTFNIPKVVGTNVGSMYIDDIVFVKTEAHPVTFTLVRNDNGNPISGASVSINNQNYITDNQGMCTTDALEVGEYSYTATKNGFYDATSTITVSDASIDFTVPLTADDATVVDGNEDFDYKIYPNPASALINVASPVGSTITIYSISGNKIKVLTNSSSLTTINVSDMAKGLYIVEIVSNETKVIEKVQIK